MPKIWTGIWIPNRNRLALVLRAIYGKVGAGGRTRTDMVLPPVDFESTTYTNFATPAGNWRDHAASHSLPSLGSSGSLGLPVGEASQYSRFDRRSKIECNSVGEV